MIGLFDFDWRRSFQLDQIESIVDAGNGAGHERSYKLTMKGENTSRDLTNYAYGRLMARPVQLMPAQPGVYALAISSADGDPHLHKTPVIAWALCFDGSVRIVTPEGVDDGHMWPEGGGYILMPDGAVQSVGGYLDVTAFETVDAYFAYQIGEQHEQREAQS